jgi:hypothetical protein
MTLFGLPGHRGISETVRLTDDFIHRDTVFRTHQRQQPGGFSTDIFASASIYILF